MFAGKKVLFSEQQLMDCSWGHGLNKACDGGDYDAAMNYLKELGGIIDEERYEYLGADGFCRDRNITIQLYAAQTSLAFTGSRLPHKSLSLFPAKPLSTTPRQLQ